MPRGVTSLMAPPSLPVVGYPATGASGTKGVCHGIVAYPLNTPLVRRVKNGGLWKRWENNGGFNHKWVGESAHITHSAQSRTNVRKSLIIYNMTWRETSCGYHRIPSTVPSWPDTIVTPYHKFRSSCSAFVNLHLLHHPVNMPPCKLHGLALSYFSWVTKWSMLEPCTVRWK